jgi:hypothetical protein
MVTLKKVLQATPSIKSDKDGKNYWVVLVYGFSETPTSEKINSVMMVPTDELNVICEKYELMTDYENRVWDKKNPDNKREPTTIEKEIDNRKGIVIIRVKQKEK